MIHSGGKEWLCRDEAESKTLFNALVKFWFVGIQIYQPGCGFPDELKKLRQHWLFTWRLHFCMNKSTSQQESPA
jgi:hypothetical protein